jgi:hypothetical protein
MKLPLIIEKSAIRKGEYVAYIHGAQRIRRDGRAWVTYTLGSTYGVFIYAFGSTLAELVAMLEKRGEQVAAKLKGVQQ